MGMVGEPHARQAAKWQLMAPTWSEAWKIEYSVHNLSPRMIKELRSVFVDIALEDVLIVPTFQVCMITADAPFPPPALCWRSVLRF